MSAEATAAREARRQTPLADKLKVQIRRDGPLSVADYMRACLHDPDHGYYRIQTAIGADGDFITAPEISQVFGELIGLWAVVVWHSMGRPEQIDLIELGPGRGTLMRDALRASALVPDFHAAVHVRLVECSPTLQTAQRNMMRDAAAPVSWMDELPNDDTGRAAIIVANEFLDTLPTQQYFRNAQQGWSVRTVGLSAQDELEFKSATACDSATSQSDTVLDKLGGDAVPGNIFERQDFSSVRQMLEGRGTAPTAALFVDYGHVQTAVGDTLQALREHQTEHPLTSPGEADLTAHVDFEAFADAIEMETLASDGPVTQSEFLGALGIVERASKLMGANPDRAAAIEAGVARLMAPHGMGGRFKVLGVRSAGVSPLPGLQSPPGRHAV